MAVDKYQRNLESAALSIMAVMMALTAISLILSPSANAAAAAAKGGITAAPALIGILCVGCTAGYLWLKSPDGRKPRTNIRRLLYWVFGLPLAIYASTLGLILLSQGYGIVSFSYAVMIAVLFFSGFAVFGGYSRTIEIIQLAALITLLLLIAHIVSVAPLVLLESMGIAPWIVVLMCAVGCGGYASFLHPKVAALPFYTKQRLFTWSAFVLPFISIITVLYMMGRGNVNLLSPLIVIDLHLLIAVTGKSLYKPDAPHGE